ncbi:hypothetical protein [Alkalihalobacillus sp. 1P02AB]|uniref:hypothetical protein n=1 Tax=Alkalihalobacillus sp. 1P02AB TaxID=3132260 RepID=UPI0039A4ABD0
MKPKQEQQISKGMSSEKALVMIQHQMKLNGYRERTLKGYNDIFNHFLKATGIVYLEDITVHTLYVCLESMNVYGLNIAMHV